MDQTKLEQLLHTKFSHLLLKAQAPQLQFTKEYKEFLESSAKEIIKLITSRTS